MDRATSIVMGLLATACGLAGSHAVRPAGSTVGQPDAPLVAVPLSAEGDQTATAPHRDLDLTEFRPLLAEPELAVVRRHVDREEFEQAAAILGAELSKSSPQGTRGARLHYLYGLLLLGAGDTSRALDAFGHAGEQEWILREDALLQVAALQLSLGKAAPALATLERVVDLRDSPRERTVRAAALASLKKYDPAVSLLRALADETDDGATRLELAEVLLDQAESFPEGKKRLEIAGQAAFQAQLAALGHGPDDEVSKHSRALLGRAAASGARPGADLSLDLQLRHLRGLVDAREFEEAEEASLTMAVPPAPKFSKERCEYDYLVGKALAGLRRWGEAADRISSSADNCASHPEVHAWLLFNAGKYSAADGRHTKAVRFYGELERLYRGNSLADDARLRTAKSYESAGITARFVSLLASMPEDYPDGDMTMEGVLTLALYRIERGDWAGAAQVLDRGASIVRNNDSARGHEYSGTERYFLARARQELGEEEEALREYESIVRDVPLSYYMLHAYSRLLEAEPARAKEALEEGLSRSQSSPFSFPHRPEYESPKFLRGMEMLRVGDTDRGKALLGDVGLGEGADDSLLWGIALLYDRAGDAHMSHSIARGRLTDWFAHYPEGDWQGAWEIGFPRPYYDIVKRESQATGVPEWLIYGVMREESTFQPRVVSHANAYGLMQVIEPTARGIARKSGHPSHPDALKTPSINIAIGSRVLKELDRRFRENPWLAIPGYNAGPGNPSKWLRERPNVDFDVWVEMIPYRETRRYTKRVLASRAAYAFVYYRQDSQTALVLPKRLTPP